MSSIVRTPKLKIPLFWGRINQKTERTYSRTTQAFSLPATPPWSFTLTV
jgi:hypothetical protein